MTRLSALLLLGGAGVLLSPTAASAQFGRPVGAVGGFGYGGARYGMPVIGPNVNPFFYVPQYRYQYGSQYSFQNSLGSVSFGSTRYYVGVVPPSFGLNPVVAAYAQSGSYMTGGSNRADLVQAADSAVARAQREAALPGAKALIAGQASYEKGAPAVESGVQVPPDVIAKALAAPDPAKVASGEALNVVLAEIGRAEAKGAKGPSAFVPALLLDEVRFAGPPAADVLNLARQAGRLEFPAAFDAPPLAALRDELEKDFAAVGVAVMAGKAPEPAKLAKLDATFLRVQAAAGPAVKELPFEEAAAARRFLNRMAAALKGLKAGAANGLIDPKWATEGLTAADLVKHMARHKLKFGPAPSGEEEAYQTMHRNLATYLYVLSQPKQ